jgi:hypothetical protein
MPQYRPKDSPKTIYYRICSCGHRPSTLPTDLVGRSGYEIAKKLTDAVRSRYDDLYTALLEPVGDVPLPKAPHSAALRTMEDMKVYAARQDEIHGGQANQHVLQNLVNTINEAKTVGDLDNLRMGLNRLVATYEKRTTAGRYQLLFIEQAMVNAADNISESLCGAVAKLRGHDNERSNWVRELQKRHGAALQADRMMEETMARVSSAASEEASPPGGIWGIIWRISSPSTLNRFNACLGRVIEGATCEENGFAKEAVERLRKLD